jgi:hypothetical protein
MTEIMQPLHRVLGYISRTKIFGSIPLDMLLHFLFGMILTIVFRRFKFSYWKATGIVLALEICKEIFDSFALTATWQEAFKDILVTMSYPFILGIVTYFLKKTEVESKEYF